MLDYELINAREPGSRRLMVMLHGLGDSIEGYRWWPEALGLPWLNHLLVNAPDDYYGGYSWFNFAGDPAPGVARSYQQLQELLDSQRAAGFPSEQMVLGGFSQGSLMAIETALRFPHRFAGVVGISGYVCEPEKLVSELSPVARDQRLLVTHGTHDPLIPIAPVRRQMEILRRAGLKLEWHEFAKEHTIAGETELSVIREFIKQVFGYKTG